ncbi:MAG: family 10 glycosylhydrolase [Planctomycetia bacterium]|nr:family 10 glycosylhydrolase [Planctomycetia bacterium]
MFSRSGNFYWILILGFLIITSASTESQEYSSEIIAKMLSKEVCLGPATNWGEPILDLNEILQNEAIPGSLALPFASAPTLSRVCLDRNLKLDASQFGDFYLSVEYSDPRAVRYVTLYFHSGNGWFSMTGSPRKMGRNETVLYQFSPALAETEGTPDSLERVDSIRLAFWKGIETEASVALNFLTGTTSSVAILADNQYDGVCRKFLERGGIPSFSLKPEEMTPDRLQNITTLILPNGEVLTDAMIPVLSEWLDRGGFLVACYGLPESLMKKLGFSRGQYIHSNNAGISFSEVRFTDEYRNNDLAPKLFKQNSHNIIYASPITDLDDDFLKKQENRPIIAAFWFDEKGQKTEYPAMLASGRGIYFSHVFLSDDSENKQLFWTDLLIHRDPLICGRILTSCWIALLQIGLTPYSDKSQQEKAAIQAASALEKQGWNISEVLDLIAQKRTSSQKNNINRLLNDLRTILKNRSIAYCQGLQACPNETRFFWEHSGLGAWHGDWDRTMKALSEAGFNGVLPNMCWGGRALYNSDVLPLDERTKQYGDQIEQAVRAGQKYGVEVHVWKVNFNASGSSQEFADQMIAEGRVQKSFQGKNEDRRVWLCPSHPKNQLLEIDAMTEIATKYDVNGIHFDYIRYPDNDHCFCDGCRDRFFAFYLKTTGKQLENWPEIARNDPEIKKAFDQWRCDQITAVVRGVHDKVKAVKPSIKISAAVFNGYPGTKQSIGQDWGLWIEKGYLDFVCPMNYTDDSLGFATMVENQMNVADHRIPLFPGIGLTVPRRLQPDELAVQIETTRKNQTGGFILFDLNQSTAETYLPLLIGTPFADKPETTIDQ